MKPALDCVPCFCRQALEATRYVTSDAAVQERVLRTVLRRVSEMDMDTTPPEMGRYIHETIRDLTGSSDPYSEAKKQSNRAALELYPELKRRVSESECPLETAARLAIAGNVIDLAIHPHINGMNLVEELQTAMRPALAGRPVDELKFAAAEAEHILFLGDNAGEILFDRLLIEELPREKITYVVRGRPIINDATLDDARAVGLTGIVPVIDNGDDTPGTLPERCSEDFRARFEQAQLIIAKGQGNYETLSDVPRPIFFLFMAKCPVVAGQLGCSVGTPVLLGRAPLATSRIEE